MPNEGQVSSASKSTVRVVVCGSNYGAMYARAVHTLPGFRLVGILARGSPRSIRLADQFAVPLFKDLSELPSGVDVACVAVGGKAASALTAAFLSRGVHVLAEHPVEPAIMKSAFAAARQTGAVYHVNAHWGDLPPARAFVDECFRAQQNCPPIFLSVQTSPRLLYSALDIVARVLRPTAPFSPMSLSVLDVPHSIPSLAAGSTWKCASGILEGVPTVLQCSSWTASSDDLSDFFVAHRISVVLADGSNVLLGEAAGPAIRYSGLVPDPRILLSPSGPVSPPRSLEDISAEVSTRRDPLWTDIRGEPPVTYANQLLVQRQGANQLALQRLWDQVSKGITPPEQSEAHLLTTSRLWSQFRTVMWVTLPLCKNLLWAACASLRKMQLGVQKFYRGPG